MGLALFLAADVMAYTGVFGAYVVLRTAAPHWKLDGGLPLFPALARTLVLILSLLPALAGVRALRRGNPRRARHGALLAGACGLVALGLLSWQWGRLTREGLLPSTNSPAAFYFVLTGFTGLHLLFGASWLYREGRRAPGRWTEPALWFWVYVVGLWCGLFLLFVS